mgnify:CR=1 FL=1
MTKQATQPTRTRIAIRSGRVVLVLGMVTMLAAGCTGIRPRNSTKSLTPVDTTTLPDAADVVAKESEMLAKTHDKLVSQVERAAPAQPLPPVQPKYDPLEDKVVTIRMYDASVSTLLWAMSDQLGMNLVLDPSVQAINQKATLNLTNVTAREVFNHILQAFDLYGKAQGNTLYVNTMEEKVYNLDFLNTRMNVDISDGGNVFGSNNAGGSSGSGGGSQGSSGSGNGNSLRSDFTMAGGIQNQSDIYGEIDNALKVVLGDSSQSRQRERKEEKEHRKSTVSVYSLNPVTGTLFVRARPSEVSSVEKIISRYKSVMDRQVQIDAQLIDVQLNDGYQFGVDWNMMRQYVAGVVGNNPLTLGSAERMLPGGTQDGLPPRTLTLPSQLIGNTTGRSVGIGYADKNFSVAVNMLRTFGDVKVLSNPTIRARNGSPALLSVGTNIRYVANSTSFVSNPGGGAENRSTNTQTDSVFSGLMVGVVPFIHEDGTVELLVHPVQSDVDPSSLQLIDVGGSMVTLPVTSFKGMTTTLNVNDGATVMIGGLIDQQLGTDHAGVPGISDIPILGRVFDKTKNSHRSRELVMIMRVKVL